MTNEEKFRLEDPEEEVEPVEEKKGLFRPLPQSEQKTRMKDGKSQPITRFLGITMLEKHRDIIAIILMPMLTAIINSSIFSFVTLSLVEGTATYLFFLPVVAAIPIGLVIAETGPALVGGFLSSIFFLIFFVLFLITPAFYAPELGIANFLISGIALSVAYYLFIVVAGLLGSVVGTIMREFL
ncbi:MAG: hypothetical protein RTU63_11980 [Candidatus Thorarchaeota archaeon]